MSLEDIDFNKELVKITDVSYTKVDRGFYFGDRNTLYVFGDNIGRVGRKGQSNIRFARNAVGIITKRFPSMAEGAFLTDSIFDMTSQLIVGDIANIHRLLDGEEFTHVHFPSHGLGTGLANLKSNAPKTFDYLSCLLYDMFGYTNPGYTPEK